MPRRRSSPGSARTSSATRAILPCAEINSSFHRPHALKVYERWAASTPPSFRFSVKLPRTITHEGELRRPGPLLDAFFAQISGLGEKLGALLVQLPPSQAFNSRVAGPSSRNCASDTRDRSSASRGTPRGSSRARTQMLVRHRVARVATDPSRIKAALHPAGWMPDAARRRTGDRLLPPARITAQVLVALSARAPSTMGERDQHAPANTDVWCIFDNTASGAAIENALEMMALLSPVSRRPPSRSPTP